MVSCSLAVSPESADLSGRRSERVLTFWEVSSSTPSATYPIAYDLLHRSITTWPSMHTPVERGPPEMIDDASENPYIPRTTLVTRSQEFFAARRDGIVQFTPNEGSSSSFVSYRKLCCLSAFRYCARDPARILSVQLPEMTNVTKEKISYVGNQRGRPPPPAPRSVRGTLKWTIEIS